MRSGATLLELMVVLALLAVAAGLTVPSLRSLRDPGGDPTEAVLLLVRQARRLAMDSSRTTWLQIRRSDGHYWLIQHTMAGAGILDEGTLENAAISGPHVIRVGHSADGFAYGDSMRIASGPAERGVLVAPRGGEVVFAN